MTGKGANNFGVQTKESNNCEIQQQKIFLWGEGGGWSKKNYRTSESNIPEISL